MATSRSTALRNAGRREQVDGLSPSRDGRYWRGHHWDSRSLVLVQAVLPCKLSSRLHTASTSHLTRTAHRRTTIL